MDTTRANPNTLPGSADTAYIGGNGLVVLNGPDQAVAGLTNDGNLTVASKLSVTTFSSSGIFNLNANGEFDVLSSGDFFGSGNLNGHIDVPSVLTFDMGSLMTLGVGASITGGGLVNLNGGVTCDANLSPNDITLALNNDGGNTTYGSLTGSGSLDDWNEFDWSGGALGLTGGVTVEPTSDFKTLGPDAKELSAGTLASIAQRADLGGTGTFQIDDGASFVIQAGTVAVSLPHITDGNSGTGAFINDANGTLDFEPPDSTPPSSIATSPTPAISM